MARKTKKQQALLDKVGGNNGPLCVERTDEGNRFFLAGGGERSPLNG